MHATAEEAARARDAEALKEGVKRLNFPLETLVSGKLPVRVICCVCAIMCTFLPWIPAYVRKNH